MILPDLSRLLPGGMAGKASLSWTSLLITLLGVALPIARGQSLVPYPQAPEVVVTTDENGQIFAEWEGFPGCSDLLESGSDLHTWTPVLSTWSLGEHYRVYLGRIDPAAPLPPGATDWSTWTFHNFHYNLRFVASPTGGPKALAT